MNLDGAVGDGRNGGIRRRFHVRRDQVLVVFVQHPVHAAIRDAQQSENLLRAEKGKPPVQLRIGIHSGQATVGNIGPAGRVNYTAIGDMVNVAQRLEQLGKQIDTPVRDVVILISDETMRDLDDSFDLRAVGCHQLKGREAEQEVYELIDGPTEPFADEADDTD